MPKIRPHELLIVGGPVTLAFLTSPRYIWEIDQAQLDKPPWFGATDHYRCPGCGAAWNGTSMGLRGGRAVLASAARPPSSPAGA